MRSDFRPVRITLIDQTAAILRTGLAEGRWEERLPGAAKLAHELGVSAGTVKSAQRRLRKEGLLRPVGERRALRVNPGKIAVPGGKKNTAKRAMRIAILNPEPLEAMTHQQQLFLLQLFRELAFDGHTAFCAHIPAGKASGRLRRLDALVRAGNADIWLPNIMDAEVLAWFRRSGRPALALGGAFRDIGIPAVYSTMLPVVSATLDRLLALGHTRIVAIVPERWCREPAHSAVTAFRSRLEAAGIRVGDYHLPAWRETPEGLAALFDNLFRVTPPTAILALAEKSSHGVLHWLAEHGLNIPRDVSVVIHESDPGIVWARPGSRLIHFEEGNAVAIRIIRRWIADTTAGRARRDDIAIPLRLTPGDSVGPAKR